MPLARRLLFIKSNTKTTGLHAYRFMPMSDPQDNEFIGCENPIIYMPRDVTLPAWLIGCPQSWIVECFDLSVDHAISNKWGRA